MSLAAARADRAFVQERLATYGFRAEFRRIPPAAALADVPEFVNAVMAILHEDRLRRGQDSKSAAKPQ